MIFNSSNLFILGANIEDLPLEMLGKILLKAILSSDYLWPYQVVQTYNNTRQTSRFFDLIVKFCAQ